MKRANFKGERIKKRKLDTDVSDVGKKSRSKAIEGHRKHLQVSCLSAYYLLLLLLIYLFCCVAKA